MRLISKGFLLLHKKRAEKKAVWRQFSAMAIQGIHPAFPQFCTNSVDKIVRKLNPEHQQR